jgi:hypothetical protein
LSGIFYVADSLFEQFRNARDESSSILLKEAMDDEFNLGNEINLDTATAFLNWKFPEREFGDRSSISSLLNELKNAGIESFQRLNEIIDENMTWFHEYEKKVPPSGKKYKKYLGVGVARLIVRHRVGE